ncbi:MAG TPA: ATP-binding protein [bacterium]|nr:ATP-binding protein [bacterium]
MAQDAVWANDMAKDIEAIQDITYGIYPADAIKMQPAVSRIAERYARHLTEVSDRLDPLLKVRLTTYSERSWSALDRWGSETGLGEAEISQLRSDLKVLRKILVLAGKRLEKEALAERREGLLFKARMTAGMFGAVFLFAFAGIVMAWRSKRRLISVAKRIGLPAAGASELMTHAERIGDERVSAESADRKELTRERTILKRYRDILDSLQAGIVAADAASERVLFVNTVFHEWFGTGPEFIGEPLKAVIAKSGVDIALPGKLPHAGKTYWRDVTAVAGTVLYVVRDISEQERLASRLLNSERLISIGEMASKVTHEIRNPLSTVKLNAEYIADNAKKMTPDELAASIALIVKEVIRLEEITDRYMGMVRYRAEDEPAQKTLLPEALNDLLKFHEGEFRKRSITLDVAMVPDVELTIALNSFREVMLNLLKNAWEELGDGGRIAVSGAIDDRVICLRIDDSGRGVPAAEREKIFRNFYTTKPGGTGIGLSHSLKLVTEAGGTIAVEDSPLGGARFIVTIPRVVAT